MYACHLSIAVWDGTSGCWWMQFPASVQELSSVPQDRLGDSGCVGDISVAHSIPGRAPSLPQEPASPLLPSHGQTANAAAESQNGVSAYRNGHSLVRVCGSNLGEAVSMDSNVL